MMFAQRLFMHRIPTVLCDWPVTLFHDFRRMICLFSCVFELACADMPLKPNTHRRRRRDEIGESRRVGVGGVYMNSRRLPMDSAMRTHNAAVGRDPVYTSVANAWHRSTI